MSANVHQNKPRLASCAPCWPFTASFARQLNRLQPSLMETSQTDRSSIDYDLKHDDEHQA